MLTGSWSFTDAKFRVLGRDILKLAVGASSPVNADLEFYDADGNRWQLRWGPYEHAGSGISYNPGSDPVIVTRMDADTWDFTTTGQHHAALYRYDSPSQTNSQHYYGQFVISFSGLAVALSDQPTPNPGVSAINVKLTPPEVAILEPNIVDEDVTFEAIAFDHCLDISAATLWTVDGPNNYFTNGNGAVWTWDTSSVGDGEYAITANAINRNDAIASDMVQITVGTPSTSPDDDGDGWTVANGDCNDNDSSVYPGANDTKGKKGRDGIDNDCNGVIDG